LFSSYSGFWFHPDRLSHLLIDRSTSDYTGTKKKKKKVDINEKNNINKSDDGIEIHQNNYDNKYFHTYNIIDSNDDDNIEIKNNGKYEYDDDDKMIDDKIAKNKNKKS
jgi:hypothetical protein